MNIILQTSWKLEETRKYYALYNTLETTLSFLQKEVSVDVGGVYSIA